MRFASTLLVLQNLMVSSEACLKMGPAAHDAGVQHIPHHEARLLLHSTVKAARIAADGQHTHTHTHTHTACKA